MDSTLIKSVNDLGSSILTFLIPFAAVGVIAMALVEGWKKLVGARRRFHAKHWSKFIEQIPAAPADHAEALEDLLFLSSGIRAKQNQVKQLQETKKVRNVDSAGGLGITSWVGDRIANAGGPAYAVFSQDTPVMVSTMMEAIDVALAAAASMDPATKYRYKALLAVMCHDADPADLQIWLQRGKKERGKNKEAETARNVANAHVRLRQIAKRKLDAFAIYAQERWANNNQFWAHGIGFVLMLAALVRSRDDILPSLPIALFGGLLAPVAKDLVSAIKKAREP